MQECGLCLRSSRRSCKTRQRHFEAFPAWLRKAGVTATPLTYMKGSGQIIVTRVATHRAIGSEERQEWRKVRLDAFCSWRNNRSQTLAGVCSAGPAAALHVVPLPASQSLLICARALSNVPYNPSSPQVANGLSCCVLKERACHGRASTALFMVPASSTLTGPYAFLTQKSPAVPQGRS